MTVAPPMGSRADRALDALFEAKSVAVIGASNTATKLAGRPISYLLSSGYTGEIYPINPSRTEVQGLPSYAALTDLDKVPELALVVVPGDRVEAAVRDCAAVGVPVVIVMSAGFAESGPDGAAAQQRIVDDARAAGTRLLGPNCLGAFNSGTGLCASFSAAFVRGLPTPGPVGIVSQSGAYGSHVIELIRARGIGVQYWITTGNQADIDVADAIEWMAARDDVKVILAYVEGVRDGSRLIEALRAARAARTPVVLLKSGSSNAGKRAAGSHTGELSGADAVFDQVVRQYGGYRARTVEEQIDIVYACLRGGPVHGDRLAIVTMSGGVGAQMCDSADRYGLTVPELRQGARKRVQELLPYASAVNPVDCTAQVLQDMEILTAAFEVILSERSYDAIVAFFSTVLLDPVVADRVLASVQAAMRHRAGEVIVICMVALPQTVRAFEDAGFLVFEDPDRAVRAVAALRFFTSASTGKEPKRPWAAGQTAEALTGRFDELSAMAELARTGIPVLESKVVVTAEEAGRAARELGLPVVLKVLSEDIAHKSDVGGVALGLQTSEAVEHAFDEVITAVRLARPDANISGALVTPMAAPGIEMLVGLTRDPSFGPVVTLGMGGIFVEILGDTTLRLAPVNHDEARGMVKDLRGSALLEGARGGVPADTEALVSALVAISEFGAEHPEVASVEINPLVVWSHGAAALDGAIEINQTDFLGASGE
ncbi:MAG: acyl-CoA synthetase forming [Frankiales bacterium]|nr:acyl-CoA synthetase forming [Frankiales bacterium]